MKRKKSPLINKMKKIKVHSLHRLRSKVNKETLQQPQIEKTMFLKIQRNKTCY